MSGESSKISQFIEGLPWDYQVQVNNATIYMNKKTEKTFSLRDKWEKRKNNGNTSNTINRKKGRFKSDDKKTSNKEMISYKNSYVLNVVKRVEYSYASSSQKNISRCMALIPSFKLAYPILCIVSMYCQNFQIYYILVVQVSFPSWLWNHLVSLLRTNLYFLFSHFFFLSTRQFLWNFPSCETLNLCIHSNSERYVRPSTPLSFT